MTQAEIESMDEILARSGYEVVLALVKFCEAIEATGGVLKDDEGFPVPCADEEWIDLGEAYEAACVALGRAPKQGVGVWP